MEQRGIRLFSYEDLRWSVDHSSPPLTGSAKVVQSGGGEHGAQAIIIQRLR